MSVRKSELATCLAIIVIAVASAAYAQQTAPAAPQDPAEIIRIKTELVQAEVMVLDRQGRFVEGLSSDQFQVMFNGERRPLSFFEEVVTGSSRERAQIASARGHKELPDRQTPALERGRTIFFFLDDIHLSPASVARARKALQKFVDDDMDPNDQVAIVSTSGQIGFLQQLTDHPAVLRAAIARLTSKPSGDVYTGKTQISAYLASQVFDHGNRELFAALLESTKVEQQMGPGSRHGDHGLAASYTAVPHLRNRLRQINDEGRMTTEMTLAALESLIDSSSELPGRKTVFFLSDGFTVNERKAGALKLLQRITRKAAASRVIVYTMDARGTTFNLGSSVDASSNDYWDASSRRAGLARGEIIATREPLNLIAKETGGRAIFDSNSIDDAIRQSVSETSKYYLVAWRPQSAFELGVKSQARILISNRPDLTVRWRSNYSAPDATETAGNSKTVSANDDLRATVEAAHPKKLLPLSLLAGYVSSANGEMIKISMQVERQLLDLNRLEQSDKTEVDVVGVVIDDRGVASSFKQLVTVKAKLPVAEPLVTWHQQLAIEPGIYQIRIAVRERSSGLMGSARQWIEIPESASRLALSSLFLGERKQSEESKPTESAEPTPITIDVDRRFARSSILRFQTYVYRAEVADGQADVWIQASVLSNRRQLLSAAPAKVPNNGDTRQLAYWSEIPLQSLAPGQYVLLLSATDRLAKTTTTQQIRFSVE